MKVFSEIWAYRGMIANLVKRDLKSRYKGSVLGFFWTFLNPLLQLVVYTIVFSTIMRMGIEDFYLFLFVALVPWIFFSTCLTGGPSIIFSQQDMVKKIYFPREVLPLSFVISQFVNMLFSFVIVFIAVIYRGVPIHLLALLCLPLVMAIEFLLALGITYLVSAIAVYFRDLQPILGIVSMAWMYLTPIVYSVEYVQEHVPEQFVKLFYLNPMTTITIAYRDILYYGRIPELGILVNAIIMGVVFWIVGHVVFAKLQRHFVEEL